jgi:hypothetical protein
MGDNPDAVVATLARITTRRLADRKSSGLFVRAACANRTGSVNQPTTNIRMIVIAPKAAALARCSSPPLPPSAPSKKMIGKRARSSKSSIGKASRPTLLEIPAIGRTSAVDDRASASPSPSAASLLLPSATRPPAIRTAETISSAAPKPITRRRMPHSRRKESSNPIEKSRRMIPSSANGPIASGSVIET